MTLNRLRTWLLGPRIEDIEKQLAELRHLILNTPNAYEFEERLKVLAGCLTRMDTLERAFMEQEKAHSDALRELQEGLDSRKRRAPSGRPFSVLRGIAEAGERARAERDAG